MLRIKISQNQIDDFCKRHHIKRLAFFGSVLRDDFDNNSDVDVLVEFDSGHVPGFSFFDMEDELTQILGRKADLNTPKFLSRYFRHEVIKAAEVQYANG